MSNAKRHAQNAADKLGHLGEVVITDGWDDGDEWASVMTPLFDLVGAVYILGGNVPDDYSPGLSVRNYEPDSESMEELLNSGHTPLEQMEQAIRELMLARDVLIAEGKDY